MVPTQTWEALVASWAEQVEKDGQEAGGGDERALK